MLIEPAVMYFFSGVGLYLTCCINVWLVNHGLYWLRHKEFMPSVADVEARMQSLIHKQSQTIDRLKTERDLEAKRADEASALLEETVSKLTNMLQ